MPINNDLILKPINELLKESFYIPAYQRGYRWTQRQVVELLNDIREFQQQSENKEKKAFYCLQPVVVKKRGGEWELVDGQQRLTTIRIILSCLKELVSALGKERYNIRYETRSHSERFLDDLDDSQYENNIDFYHMYKAKEAIEKWFGEKDGTYKIKFLQTLLNDDDTGKNVKVIWYQINEDTDSTAVFARLNIGKIPLTSSELIKALFLKGDNFNKNGRHLNQLKIAQEWDDIERHLQSDDFWFFISNNDIETNRIEFLLNIVADDLNVSEGLIPKRDPLYAFLVFSHWVELKNGMVEEDWSRVKRCYMALREWYEDRIIYHIIGFLVSRGVSIANIFSIHKKCGTKDEFRQKLTSLVFEKGMPGLVGMQDVDNQGEFKDAIEEYLDEIRYDSKNSHVSSVLLLFNMATLLVNPDSNTRFRFDLFKNESWDIEHIRSVASDMPKSTDRQKLWLEGVIEYIESEIAEGGSIDGELKKQLAEVLISANDVMANKVFDSQEFEGVFDTVIGIYSPNADDEIDHSIGNLTLLDSTTNRSYQNAIFPIKRQRIISLDKTATFVPICTKNAFLKYYSEHVDNMMFWSTSDSRNHQAAMAEILSELYIKEGRTHE